MRFLIKIIPVYFFIFILSCEKNLPYDIIFKNGVIVDGLGNEPYKADIGIKGNKIVKLEQNISSDLSKQVIDVSNRIISPGFIDNHAHIQTNIHEHPLAENFIRQGITTILASLHSGDQPWPIDEYAMSLEVAPNIGFFCGHTWIRKQVLGMDNRDPSDIELIEMKNYVKESMKMGAIGFTTGLLYVPANFAKIEEVIELAKVASSFGGIYVTHMRNEATGLLNSVRETIKMSGSVV